MRAFSAPLLVLAAALASPAAQAVSDDRFLIGGSVRQETPVEGDLIGVGGSVEVVAPVGGDVVVTGGDIRIGAAVKGDVYAAGGNVDIDAAVGRNVRVAGGNVEVRTSGRVEGNLSALGGTVAIRGPVAGQVQAASGDVLVDSAVGGDVHVASGSLTLGPNARVGGRVSYRGDGEATIDPAAQVAGGIAREPGSAGATRTIERARVQREGGGSWFWTFGMMVLAGTIAAAFPAGTRRVGEKLRRDPAITMLFGFAVLVCTPVAAVILAVTIIGIPVALAVLFLYAVMLIVGYAALAVVLGDSALARLRAADAGRRGWRAGAAVLAMLAMGLAAKLPVIGGLLVFAALLAGVGALVLALRRDEPNPDPGFSAA